MKDCKQQLSNGTITHFFSFNIGKKIPTSLDSFCNFVNNFWSLREARDMHKDQTFETFKNFSYFYMQRFSSHLSFNITFLC